MSHRVKVLILSHSSELNGAERSMIDLFDYWHKHGLVEPIFIIRRPHRNMVAALKKRGWSYFSLYYTNWAQREPEKTPENIFSNSQYNTKAVKEIEKIIKSIQPDVVMTNTIVSPWAAIAAYFAGVPHVWFVREYGDLDHKLVFEQGRDKTYQDVDTLSELVVANSETLADHLKKYIDNNKIKVVYTPFDVEKLNKEAVQHGNNPFKYSDSIKLVITGRIAPSKGQDEAAKAVGKLNNLGYKIELCIIGTSSTTEDEKSLKETIDKYEISDKVHLIGYQSNPLSIVKYADVGIMSSQQEAFGRVTFEYMAIGKPVIGSNSGASPEIIDDGVNGYLYKKDSADDLVEKLLKYLNNKNLIYKHGKNARLKTIKMMQGKNNAEKLIEDIKKTQNNKLSRPLNISRRWLDYPIVAQQYIDKSGHQNITRLVKQKAKNRLKATYLKVARYLDNKNAK
jgi:glycosyltransferase involved in cell wall biosynthesis